VLAGELDTMETKIDPIFGLAVPAQIKGVPASVLSPRWTWSDPAAYDAQAKKLAAMFRQNFEKFGTVDAATKNAGPKG
jgi:phosphoenolpyruvate carboxykinase (ATP)